MDTCSQVGSTARCFWALSGKNRLENTSGVNISGIACHVSVEEGAEAFGVTNHSWNNLHIACLLMFVMFVGFLWTFCVRQLCWPFCLKGVGSSTIIAGPCPSLCVLHGS